MIPNYPIAAPYRNSVGNQVSNNILQRLNIEETLNI